MQGHFEKLPASFRFFVTSRPEYTVQQRLSRFEPEVPNAELLGSVQFGACALNLFLLNWPYCRALMPVTPGLSVIQRDPIELRSGSQKTLLGNVLNISVLVPALVLDSGTLWTDLRKAF